MVHLYRSIRPNTFATRDLGLTAILIARKQCKGIEMISEFVVRCFVLPQHRVDIERGVVRSTPTI